MMEKLFTVPLTGAANNNGWAADGNERFFGFWVLVGCRVGGVFLKKFEEAVEFALHLFHLLTHIQNHIYAGEVHA